MSTNTSLGRSTPAATLPRETPRPLGGLWPSTWAGLPAGGTLSPFSVSAMPPPFPLCFRLPLPQMEILPLWALAFLCLAMLRRKAGGPLTLPPCPREPLLVLATQTRPYWPREVSWLRGERNPLLVLPNLVPLIWLPLLPLPLPLPHSYSSYLPQMQE